MPDDTKHQFQQIADRLRERTADGTYEVDKRLPGEDALAQEFAVSLTTVRSAVDSLVTEGVLERRPRAGTFIRTYRRILRDANERLAVRQWGSGRDIWDVDAAGRQRDVDRIEVERETAPDDVATRLGTADVWVRRRRYLIDGSPVQIAVSYLPAEVVDGTPIATPNTGAGGTYARLAEIGFEPTRFSERVIVRMPSAQEVADLDLGPATPVAYIRREAVTEQGRIIEVNDMVCAGDAYVFQWRFTSS